MPLTESDPTLVVDLEVLIADEARGDPSHRFCGIGPLNNRTDHMV